MKCLKMLGLVVVAATALTAFLGAGSASATVLCTTPVSPCPAEERWGAGTALDASLSGSNTWEAGSTALSTCTGSTIAGKTTSSGSGLETISLKLETLSFSTCTKKTTVITLGELQIHSIAGTTDGTITSRGTTGEFAEIGTPCGWNFGFAGEWVDFGRIYGGNPATIEMAVPVVGTCWFNGATGSYTVTAPKPLYVVAS